MRNIRLHIIILACLLISVFTGCSSTELSELQKEVELLTLENQMLRYEIEELQQTELTEDSSMDNASTENDPIQSIQVGITLDNFNVIENGMTMEQVENIFGQKGELVGSTSDFEQYAWAINNIDAAIIYFGIESKEVMYKTQYGLE